MTLDTPPRAPSKRNAKSGAGGASASVALPALPGRRNPKWIALGLVALCLGALLSYVLYARVADQESVVAVVNTVHRGDTVTAADLTSVSLPSAAGVQAVPATQLEQLVGRRAVYDLVGGSLLPVGAVSDSVVPQPGHAVVGVRLVTGRAPAGPLPSGTPLRLVALPPAGSDSEATDRYTGRSIAARVLNKVDAADGTSVVVDVDVAAATAPDVALLAAQERLAVVRDADR